MDLRVGSKYRVGRRIGGGSFGEIYQGTHIHTLEPVAIKLEPVKTRHPQLLYESRLYKLLHGTGQTITGIPQVRWYGVEGDFNVMVVDLLGPSLEDCFNYCGRILSNKTVLMLADQMIARVEFLHNRNFLHRDIKPDNFLMGLSKKVCKANKQGKGVLMDQNVQSVGRRGWVRSSLKMAFQGNGVCFEKPPFTVAPRIHD